MIYNVGSIKNYNPVMKLMNVTFMEGDLGVSKEVHLKVYDMDPKYMTKEYNYFRFGFVHRIEPSIYDEYGPNHCGTVIKNIELISRKKSIFTKFKELVLK